MLLPRSRPMTSALRGCPGGSLERWQRWTLSLVLTIGGIALATPAAVAQYCGGDEAKMYASWPGPAEATVGVCGDVIAYHSTAVGAYDHAAPHGRVDTWKMHLWLQSGTNHLSRVKYYTFFRQHCQRQDGSWRWRNHTYAEDVREFTETNFVQQWSPVVDFFEYSAGGKAAECHAEPGSRSFLTAHTMWLLQDAPCGNCFTFQWG